jgi:hypothetical protein
MADMIFFLTYGSNISITEIFMIDVHAELKNSDDINIVWTLYYSNSRGIIEEFMEI